MTRVVAGGHVRHAATWACAFLWDVLSPRVDAFEVTGRACGPQVVCRESSCLARGGRVTEVGVCFSEREHPQGPPCFYRKEVQHSLLKPP